MYALKGEFNLSSITVHHFTNCFVFLDSALFSNNRIFSSISTVPLKIMLKM